MQAGCRERADVGFIHSFGLIFIKWSLSKMESGETGDWMSTSQSLTVHLSYGSFVLGADRACSSKDCR